MNARQKRPLDDVIRTRFIHWRARNGLNIKQMAQVMGWNKMAVYNLERGGRLLTAAELVHLCLALHVSLGTFLGEPMPR